MDSIDISIIIPCYNSHEYVFRAINSILEQDYTSYEIVVVDDGSSNREIENVVCLSNKIRLICLPHLGVSCARNRGMLEAKGKFLMFIDSDDSISPGTFTLCMKTIVQNALDAVFYDAQTIESEECRIENRKFLQGRSKHFYNNIVDGETFFVESILTGTYIESPCLFLVRSEIAKKYSYPIRMYYEDTIMTTRMLISGEIKRLMCINERCYIRWARKDSITSSKKTRLHYLSMLRVCQILMHLASNYGNSSVRKCLHHSLNSFVFRSVSCAREAEVSFFDKLRLFNIVRTYKLYPFGFKFRVLVMVLMQSLVFKFIALKAKFIAFKSSPEV